MTVQQLVSCDFGAFVLGGELKAFYSTILSSLCEAILFPVSILATFL